MAIWDPSVNIGTKRPYGIHMAIWEAYWEAYWSHMAILDPYGRLTIYPCSYCSECSVWLSGPAWPLLYSSALSVRTTKEGKWTGEIWAFLSSSQTVSNVLGSLFPTHTLYLLIQAPHQTKPKIGFLIIHAEKLCKYQIIEGNYTPPHTKYRNR